jgi:hypothetical protein
MKVATSTSFGWPKPKRANVPTRRPKSIGTTEVSKLIESADVVPPVPNQLLPCQPRLI